MNTISVNSRTYNLPAYRLVGICLDGTSLEYLEAACEVMPALRRIREKGSSGHATGAMPSFTNPNNLSIATGAPPSVHGICGNYYWDEEAAEEVMMNDPRYLRAPTVFAAMAGEGVRVGLVTTKDKLRLLLGKGLEGTCLSVEAASKGEATDPVSAQVFSDPVPGVYDPACSIACLWAGVRLLEQKRTDFLYLSTTDFVQHKYAPDHPEALAFYRELDRALDALDQLGAAIGVTADHGMNAKTTAGGEPNVRYLESDLIEAGFTSPRVILPITDPYVVHHGALGSFACVYLPDDQADRARTFLSEIEGVEDVLSREEAAATFDLPTDRIGDLVVLADRATVLGRTPEWHDLSSVREGLRSHGGRHEASVPLIFNRPLREPYRERLASGQARNYDLYDFLCNGLLS